MRELTLGSAAATERAGAALAAAIASTGGGACVYLSGELGAGKTTFARGFIAGLGHTGRVPSPTYTLVEPYELDGQRIWHLDLYRLGDPGELLYLGLEDLAEARAVWLIEWPERGGEYLPNSDLVVELKVIPEGRLAVISGSGDAAQAVLQGFVPPAGKASVDR